MKLRTVLTVLAGGLLLATGASAVTIAVNNDAAMGGTGTNCSGSNCGLEVTLDAVGASFVIDDTPTGESVIRGEFLIDPNAINVGDTDGSGTPDTATRYKVFQVRGANPTGGPPANANAFEIWLYRVFPTGGGRYAMRMFGYNNSNNPRTMERAFFLTDDLNPGPHKVCYYWFTGPSLTGEMGLALLDNTATACPAQGDPAYLTRTLTNQLWAGEQAQFGGVGAQPNNNGLPPNGVGNNSLYLDEYAMFRTLAAP
ncbi:MAG: hypothetical protein AAGC60_19410 [Acidobacteriota bacterium]